MLSRERSLKSFQRTQITTVRTQEKVIRKENFWISNVTDEFK
jgi:hypothetical protein